MAKELPEDLVTEILVWLPVVSHYSPEFHKKTSPTQQQQQQKCPLSP